METFVAETLVILLYELGLHELLAVGKLGGKSLAFSLDNDDAMDFAVVLTAEQKEVGCVFPYISPFLADLLVAVYIEFGQRAIAVEIYL